MLVYRFKVTVEEHEDFLREICILPAQKFIDFHSIIMEAAELLPCERASFFMTDKRYKRTTEISLQPAEKKIRKYDPELDEMVSISVRSKLMKDSRIKDFIEDPHQRMIYDYSGKENFTFHIELLKIMQSDQEGLYPKCIRWVGELPKKPETLIADHEPDKALITEKPVPVLNKPEAIPARDLLARLDGVEEDEEELAEIENNLDDFLVDIFPSKPAKPRKKIPEPEDLTEEEENLDLLSDEDDKEDLSDDLEHLEDYEDIEHIEMKFSGFRDDAEEE